MNDNCCFKNELFYVVCGNMPDIVDIFIKQNPKYFNLDNTDMENHAFHGDCFSFYSLANDDIFFFVLISKDITCEGCYTIPAFAILPRVFYVKPSYLLDIFLDKIYKEKYKSNPLVVDILNSNPNKEKIEKILSNCGFKFKDSISFYLKIFD